MRIGERQTRTGEESGNRTNQAYLPVHIVTVTCTCHSYSEDRQAGWTLLMKKQGEVKSDNIRTSTLSTLAVVLD